MGPLLEILSWASLVLGSVFCLIGGLGLIRMPGFYSRVHASGITDTMGAGLILVGLMFQAGLSIVTIKLAVILYVLLLTSPTAAHALVNGAYMRGLRPKTQEQGGES
jgi:multicomponent Na+:H+ antiporter subunit G